MTSLSREQIRAYREQGYVAVEGALTPDQVAEGRRIIDEFVEHTRELQRRLAQQEPTRVERRSLHRVTFHLHVTLHLSHDLGLSPNYTERRKGVVKAPSIGHRACSLVY